MTNLQEIWQPIANPESLYCVSNLGNVKGPRGLLTPWKSKSGYYIVGIAERRREYVHRLVAQAFIPNPDRKRTVNHIDGDRLNNAAANLEWATYSENHKHAYENLGRVSYLKGKPGTCTNKFGKLNHRSKPLIAIDSNGNETRFDAQREAARVLNVPVTSIFKVLKGEYKQCQGYKFKYAI